MIKLQIIGNLGKDCIVKEVNGKTVINFSVAHSERFKDNQGNVKEKTVWVECAYWTDKTAVTPYLIKGKTVFVEGTPDVDLYTNKENVTSAILRMRVQSLQLLGGVGAENSGQHAGNSSASSYSAPVAAPAPKAAVSMASAPIADDLPF